jgi:hypothetical protein
MLRIRKKDLALSLSSDCGETSLHLNAHNDPSHYIRHVVSPSLAPYVDIPIVVELDWKFLQQIRNQALAQGQIPRARQDDWTLPSTDKKNHATRPVGLLIANYRNLSIPASMTYNHCSDKCISVEIKPKAGYRAFSPLVEPLHRVKYLQSRF